MKNHNRILLGTLAFVLVVGGAGGYLLTRETPRPELSWDARFRPNPDSYGTRFRRESSASAGNTLPPMSVREMTKAEKHKKFGGSGALDRVGFIISGATTYNTKQIPGTPSAAVTAGELIRLDDTTTLRLKAIVGFHNLKNQECVFVWAMTPDGTRLSKEDTLLRGWTRTWASGWPTSPEKIRFIFERQGAFQVDDVNLVEAAPGGDGANTLPTSGGTIAQRRGMNSLVLEVNANLALPEAKELTFIVYHGPKEEVVLPGVAGSEVKLAGSPLRHLGIYAGPAELTSWGLSNTDLYFHGKPDHRIHFFQLPEHLAKADLTIRASDGTELSVHKFGNNGLHYALEGPIKKEDALLISKHIEVSRIRISLPPFPDNDAPVGSDDPLDHRIPDHWRNNGVTVKDILQKIAELQPYYTITRSGTMPFDQRVDDFPHAVTVRELLGAALEKDLRAGFYVVIDQKNRMFTLHPPESGWFERVAQYYRKLAATLGL